jgi:hypothetical protein
MKEIGNSIQDKLTKRISKSSYSTPEEQEEYYSIGELIEDIEERKKYANYLNGFPFYLQNSQQYILILIFYIIKLTFILLF